STCRCEKVGIVLEQGLTAESGFDLKNGFWWPNMCVTNIEKIKFDIRIEFYIPRYYDRDEDSPLCPSTTIESFKNNVYLTQRNIPLTYEDNELFHFRS
ncbi:unnamed protein product, partial [Didymodactylos carnosus]